MTLNLVLLIVAILVMVTLLVLMTINIKNSDFELPAHKEMDKQAARHKEIVEMYGNLGEYIKNATKEKEGL